MVAELRERFAHLNLTFSIGGQISFDVSRDENVDYNNFLDPFFFFLLLSQVPLL